MIKIPNEVIFLVLRTLKQVNPGDLYLEAYNGHLQKRGKDFFDIYHAIWALAIEKKPKRILEIGTRTGISMCQLLSAYLDTSIIERIVCCDLFNDGFISPELVKLNLRTLGVIQKTIDMIEFKQGDSKEVIPSLKETFDYILVDGGHDEITAYTDLTNVSKLIEKSGTILFDDISQDGMNLLSVWEKWKLEQGSRFDYFEDMNGKGTAMAVCREEI